MELKGLLTAFYLILLLASEAAAGTFRCNGKVQFRPCGHPVADGRIAFETVNLPKIKVVPVQHLIERPLVNLPQSRPAIVEVKSFERVGRDGLWRGFVTGKGTVRLNLKFGKSGQVQEQRAVGQIFLSKYKTTTFVVRSSIPRGRDLTWHIEAFQDIA